MGRKNTKGTKQVSAEIAEPLVDQWKAFLETRPESARWHYEMALRRHMGNPPPLPIPPPEPPLPPVVPAKPKRGRKS